MSKVPVSNQPFTAIDLFSGCGGLTAGLRSAGFQVRAAVEIDSKAQATYALNHPAVLLYRQDIRTLSARTILKHLDLRKGQLDLLAGCPPCQGFSRLRTLNHGVAVPDSRNDLIWEFLRLIEGIRPRTVMFENVPALRDDSRFKKFCTALEGFGYRLTVEVLNAADYSVPQRRRRLILLASRIHFPLIAPRAKKRRTVRDAIGTIESPAGTSDSVHAVPENRSVGVRALIERIPLNGGSRSQLPKEMQLACHLRSNGFYDVYGRMTWDDVAPTITSGCINPSKGRFLHPDEHRTITLREAALLQGFPKRYRFDVSHGKEAIALMIGNALPPPFIRAQAAELKRGLVADRLLAG